MFSCELEPGGSGPSICNASAFRCVCMCKWCVNPTYTYICCTKNIDLGVFDASSAGHRPVYGAIVKGCRAWLEEAGITCPVVNLGSLFPGPALFVTSSRMSARPLSQGSRAEGDRAGHLTFLSGLSCVHVSSHTYIHTCTQMRA